MLFSNNIRVGSSYTLSFQRIQFTLLSLLYESNHLPKLLAVIMLWKREYGFLFPLFYWFCFSFHFSNCYLYVNIGNYRFLKVKYIAIIIFLKYIGSWTTFNNYYINVCTWMLTLDYSLEMLSYPLTLFSKVVFWKWVGLCYSSMSNMYFPATLWIPAL